MACAIEITEHPDFLDVLVTGDNTVETLRTYTSEIPKACMASKKLRVLVTVRLTGSELSMLDVYKEVSAGSDNAAGLGMKVAYLDENPAHSIDNMMLAENVGRGRGIAVKTFRERAAAEAWLLTNEPHA